MRRRLDTGSYHGKLRRFSQLNLAQFYDATGVDLSLIGSDTTASNMLVLNHRTAPDLPLVWAVRMSMSFPLLWEEVIWQAEWGRYRGHDFTGHAIVDGGLLSNFPIELFVSRDPTVTAVMGPKVSQHVLGLMIDESLPVPGAPAAPGPAGIELGQLRTVRRVENLLNTALSARDKMVVEELEKWVIRLPAKGYGTVEFDMSAERRESLVNAGRLTMQAYLQGPSAAEPVIFGGADDVEAEHTQKSAGRLAKKILGGL
jgi:predicted acylesterase/phospholipase RssA